jgi:outer membrane protein, multidrug efflux system
MRRRQTLLLCAAACIAAGCTTVGPDYSRPDPGLPPAYRGADAASPAVASAETFGALQWSSVFPDPDLQALIRSALEQNYDLRVAVQRIAQARAQLTVAGSLPYPTVGGALSAPYTGYSGSDVPPGAADNSFVPQIGLGAAWEIDFWGKFKRNSESAWADLLAAEDARYAVMATLVSDIGQAYLTLRALDLTLEISRRTVSSRTQSVDLVQARLDGGVAGILDLRQAETLYYDATKTIPEFQRQIEQTENRINVLLGRNPGPIPRGRPLDLQVAAPALPSGLPLDLLTRRPDIREAEQRLISANAQIGVATADLYPRVTISGFGGAGTASVSGSNFGPYWILSVLPEITVPIFNMGRLQANVEFNEAEAKAAGLRYQQTLRQALREVSDALVAIRKRQEFRQQQELLVKTLSDASEVAKLRYEGGVSSYLEVLDTERQYFDAEIELVQARRDESLSVVQLYRALGGGWPSEVPAAAAALPRLAAAPTTTLR